MTTRRDRTREPAPSSTSSTLLDELLDAPSAPAPTSSAVVGTVIDDHHPSIAGRVQVRWSCGVESEVQRWVPTLWGLPVRTGDRVLLQQPANWGEPIVVGVIDGYAERSEPSRRDAARIELRRDEAVRLCDQRGRPLIELHEGDHGPVVKLCTSDLELAIPGHLELRAGTLRVRAESGSATLEADEDVVIRGETINLN